MPRVCVLMSTYDGERYIREQIDSILAQRDVEVSLLVRDDGSTDGTHVILDEYQKKGLLKWYTGDNLKPARSFMQLLRDAPNCDYYAFADQDDFWMNDKLYAACQMLETNSDKPALYFGQTQLADKDLNPIDSVVINPFLTFGESLVYYFVGGCTMVMNSRLREIVNKYRPKELFMHDVWIYSVALAIGAFVAFDKVPRIMYRQHGGNTVGQGFGAWEMWKRRFDRLRNERRIRSRVAREIHDGYKDYITADNREILNKVLSYRKSFLGRMSLLRDRRFTTSHTTTNIFFKLAVLLGTF
ncbi:MAG: glycosyltransferase family 2 protein [Prevotella sp.]|nr:glycosyltransferase family 2 protein [Prevotella sp.]MCR5152450.1 glycosyltransferase family 2 protein [Prevotella sp.]